MEQGDQSHNQVRDQLNDGANAVPAQSVGRLPSRRRKNGRLWKDSRKKTPCETHDHTSVGYEWLRPGWLVEVYMTKSGRTYKRYFDERGRSYDTKKEVLRLYAEAQQIDDEDYGGDEYIKKVQLRTLK